MNNRGNWGSKLGFILAAAGSAIGLGNLWKFPYITGKHGGGAFVTVYLICILLVGIPIMIAEIYIGKKTQKNPIGAFTELETESKGIIHYHKNGKILKPFNLIGWMGFIAGFLILSFYSVVIGWVFHFLYLSIKGFENENPHVLFNNLYINPYLNIFWHTIAMLITIFIVARGIQKGIETANKIMMPLLLFILIGITIYGLTLNNSIESINFMFNPDFSKINSEAVIQALGHSFFTLSLGMGAMITYGSYLNTKTSIVKTALIVTILDTLIALMAGVAIFSIVFSFNLEPSAGPGLIFKTLPIIFSEMKGGYVLAIVFFVLVLFAALTSAISLLEVVVSYFIDEKQWSRKKASWFMGGIIYLLGILSAVSSLKIFNESYLDFFDGLTTKYIMPIGGFFIITIFAFVLTDKEKQEELNLTGKLYSIFSFVVKYITPVLVLWIILNKIGVM